MAIFPKIQNPCPFQDKLASIMDGDTCRMCKRPVFDLTDMSDSERVAFMDGCTGKVCVSYKLPAHAVLAAAAAAMALAAPVAAAACAIGEVVVTAGGIRQPKAVQYVRVEADKPLPQLPVVYEDSPAARSKPASARATPHDTATAPATRPGVSS